MPRLRLSQLLCVLTLCLSLVESNANGAEPPTREARVTLPRPLESNAVHYPDSETTDADVVVELVIDEEGGVTSAVKVTGEGSFVDQALEDAKEWRFVPATRDGKPIRSKIRYLASYKKPRDVAPGVRPARTSVVAPTQPAGVKKTELVEEVTVRGFRNEGQQVRLGGTELRQIPGTFGEVFRSIELLPGVTPIVSGLPYFFIRGSPPGNTGYYIDGIRVPQLFHLGGGPGVIQPGLIDSLDFYPSYFPTSFGRATGGVVAANTIAPVPALHGEWNARLLDAGGFVEARATKDTTVLAGGRFGYPALIISLVAPDTRLWYWDYQTRVSHRISDRDTLTLLVFGSWDQLSARTSQSRAQDPDKYEDINSPQFHRIDLKWDRKLKAGAALQVATTLGFDRTSAAGQSTSSYLSNLRAKWTKPLSKEATLRAGLDVLFERYTTETTNLSDSDFAEYFPSRSDTSGALWFDAVLKPHPRVEIVPGVRAELFSSVIDETKYADGKSANIVSLDPRLLARLKLTNRLTLVSSVGMSHQPPAMLIPIPGISPASLDNGLQESLFSSIGLEVKLPAELSLALTAFRQDVTGLTDATATCVSANPRDGCFNARTRGRAYGGELMLRRAVTERLTGFLSYTLSRSTRLTRGAVGLPSEDFDASTQIRSALFTVPGEFDRTHVLNAALAYDLGRGWRAGTRFVFYTGRPYSIDFGGYKLPPYNGYRMPDFFRFDVRLEKRWKTKRGHVSFIAEWMNATLTKEALTMNCHTNYETDDRFGSKVGTQVPVRCTPDYFGPVTLPSIGVEGTF